VLRLYRFPFRAMGSPCELHLYAGSEEAARQVAERVRADVAGIEQRYSRYRPDSLLSAINRAAGQGGTIEVDPETAALLDYAETCHRESDGLFDITSGLLRKAWDFQSGRLPDPEAIAGQLPRIGWDKLVWRSPRLEFTVPGMELDFGGIAKEYAADRAATLCLDLGLNHGLVDLGGDIRVVGPHPDGSPWLAGIQHPREPEGLLATLELHSGGLASSGDYERCMVIDGRRYSHLLDPRTGWPVQGLSAVSVAAPHCLIAGSACTIAMLKGEAGPAWLEELGLPHVWADGAGRVGGSGGGSGLS
jgi:thiamine biosynthesis lipoprotein